MNILIIGSGGREEALARHFLHYSPGSHRVFTSPGNGGGAARGSNLLFPITPPFTEMAEMIAGMEGENRIDLVVVGSEDYLSAGIADVLTQAGIPVFGPSRAAARLESSKIFAKEIMAAAKVDTAVYREFDSQKSAADFLNLEFRGEKKWVLKADGLCAGKGVIVPSNREDALAALNGYFQDKHFGSAGDRIIAEEFMPGEEVSILAFTDGKTVRCLPAAQDHKRLYDGDLGPNTGGMGVYTPVPIFHPGFQKRVEDEILHPVLGKMANRGMPYRGILYAGLMIEDEKIRVVEFNVRFGDPECQCLLPLLESDLAEVMTTCIEGRLDQVDFRVNPQPAVCLVLASGGYPGKYETGKEIFGMENIPAAEGGVSFEIYHAGTKCEDGRFFTAGGRVLSLCGYGSGIGLSEVISAVYRQAEKISFTDRYYRKDIGRKGITG